MNKIGCLMIMFVIIALCAVDNEASFPANKDNYPDGFWFGTQDLLCASSNGKRGKRSPSRYTLELSHRLIYYRNNAFDLVGNSPVNHSSPNWPGAIACPITWESTPAGRSQRSISSVLEFNRGYEGRYGSYNLLSNNCHYYANRLSAFLEYSEYSPSWVCTLIWFLC